MYRVVLKMDSESQCTVDIHVVVAIVLYYHKEVSQWSCCRALCTKTKDIVDNWSYDRTCFGRSSFFRQNFCMICQRQCLDCYWLPYIADNIPPRMITHCRSWQCRISALLSMIEDYRSKGVYLLRSPLNIPAGPIDIPRTSGHITIGYYHKTAVVKRHKVLYVSAFWRDDDMEYTKLVPLTQYTVETPKIMFESI